MKTTSRQTSLDCKCCTQVCEGLHSRSQTCDCCLCTWAACLNHWTTRRFSHMFCFWREVSIKCLSCAAWRFLGWPLSYGPQCCLFLLLEHDILSQPLNLCFEFFAWMRGCWCTGAALFLLAVLSVCIVTCVFSLHRKSIVWTPVWYNCLTIHQNIIIQNPWLCGSVLGGIDAALLAKGGDIKHWFD